LTAKNRHPSLWALAHHLHDVARVIEEHGRHDGRRANVATCRCLTCRAALLAARGWPAGGSGSGPRSSDATSTTERAAGALSDTRQLAPPVFADVDEHLAKLLRMLWLTGLQLQRTAANVLSHAPDDDPVPAGSGPCQRCPHVCRPDRKEGDRLRSGYCPTCYERWKYLRRLDPTLERSAFEREHTHVDAA
jgi:hypothetical protein